MNGWRVALGLTIALAVAEPDDRRFSAALTGSGAGAFDAAPRDEDQSQRLRALVELAQSGDAEAFGQLYDHYVTGIYRYVYFRVRSKQLAEDVTSETFTRALRSLSTYHWTGKDFAAWLTTIARNLISDHYKSSRTRSEFTTDELPERPDVTATPESAVLSSLSDETLMVAVNALPQEQRDCILMRFIQQLSIAQTAQAMGRSDGAIKQLQLRAVRNLAKTVKPDDYV